MQQLASSAQLRASIARWALFTVPLCVGLGFATVRAIGSITDNPWFAPLHKPALYPPPLAFPVVWSILYVMMGLSLALLAAARGARGRGRAIIAFAVQLALNLCWSPVFFLGHQLTIGLAIIAALFIALALTIVLAWRVRRGAALLLLPYLVWVAFAGLLNWQVLHLNPAADGAPASGAVVRIEL